MRNTIVKAIPLIELDTTNLPLAYEPLEEAGLIEACFVLYVTNVSNNTIYISFDGTFDNEIVPARGVEPLRFALPMQTNTTIQGSGGLWRKGQVIWVKSTTATAGRLYISGYYT